MGWRDTIKEEAPKASSWRDTIKEEPESVSGLESTLRGAVQGATMGFADEAVGLVEGGLNSLTGDVPFEQAYEKARNESRVNFKNAEEANPGLYTTGQVGGGIASALVPGVGLAKGAGLAANVARGAALGGTAGIGMSESDDFTSDALKGTALGGAAGAAGYGVGKMIDSATDVAQTYAPKIGAALDEKVDQLGQNALGGTLKQSQKLAPGVGKQMFDEGYIGPFSSKEKIAERLQSTVGNLADENSALVNSLENQSARISSSGILDSAKQRVQDLYDAGEYNKAEALERLYATLKSRIPADVRPSVLETIKRDSQKAFETTASSATKEAGRDMAQIQRVGLEKGLKEFAPEIGEQYASRNQQMSKLIPALDIAEGAAEKEGRQTFGRFLDTQRVGPELYKSAMGPQKTGWALNKLSNIVQSSPEVLGKYAPTLQQAAQRGGHSLAVTNYLLQQKEPEYRSKIRELEEQNGK